MLQKLLVMTVIGAGPFPAEPAERPEAAEVDLVTAEGDGGSFWPRWRGPGGQGQVAGTSYPDTWSSNHNVLWKVSIPGSGNSSPIVWGDRIFLTSSRDGGSRRSILCLSRTDGRLLWKSVAPAATPESAHPKNGHASSTPSTDGKSVYAYFGNHGVLAVDFSGQRVWHRSLGSFEAYHGTASSPLLWRDRVIVVQDHAGRSFIAAFSKATGDELWRTPRSSKVGWNSPVAIRVGDRVEIVYSGQEQVQAYDPETGRELWTVRGNTFEAIPTPVVGHGLIFAASGRGGPTLAIRPGGSGDVTDSHIVWRAPKGSPFVPSPVLDGEYLYMINDITSMATAYRARTGELLWQGRLGRPRREGFSASPVVVAGKVFFTSDAGETYVLRSGESFELLHVNHLGERVLAAPALVDGRWYFRTEGYLLAIGRPEARTPDGR